MTEHRIRVGNIDHVTGEVNIAGGNIGYTEQEVSALITQIKTQFQPTPFDGRSPYKGLGVFEETDAELFFGRERLVEDLVGRVKESRTIFITGPSGSGKSSLVRAGLIPACKNGGVKALQSEHWLYETIKPGREPIEALALVFSRLKSPQLADYFRENLQGKSVLNACAESVLSSRTEQRFVLFIDQFEEAFTQITKEEDRVAFFNVLTDALTVENGRVILLFSMRSDFVSNCATYPDLNALLNQPSAFAQIGAMQPDELVSAMARPALRVGLRIDPDLIAQIINDMEGEPGILPLMQFALKDLFDSQQEKGGLIALTLSDYLQRGGIHKSLERHADDAFTRLSTGEQELARSIFSGLIEIGRGTPDTGRTASFDELVPANAKAEEVEAIVQKLADARLITTDEQAGQDMVTISHERLIDAWPWLRKLVNENRDVIAIQNEIAEDAKEWDEHQRDESYLYSGARLANASEKLEANKLVLSGLSQAFLEAGIKAHTDELEAVRQRAAQLRKRALYLTVALITALAAVGGAIFFWGQSRQQAQLAFSRQLAAQAMVIQDDKRDLAMLMSIQADQLNDEFDTRSSLLSTVQCCPDALISFMSGHEDSIWDVAFSPDGTLLASSGNDGSIRIWDVGAREQIRSLKRASTATVYTVAFSPTDQILAAGDGTGSITLYDTQTWQPISTPLRGHESSVLSIKFSRDGKLLVSSGTDGQVLVWDVPNRQLYKTFTGHTSWVWDVAISADNKTVASVGRDSTLRLWDLESGASVLKKTEPAGILVSVAFNENPHSRILLTGDTAAGVVVWDMAPWRNHRKEPVASRKLKPGPTAGGLVWGLSFIPGQNLEIVTGRDTGYLNRYQIQLTNNFANVTLKKQSLGMTGNNFGFFRIDVSPDGQYIAAAGQDGLVSLWNAVEVSSVIRHTAKVTSVQIVNRDSSVAMSVDGNGELYRWKYDKREILERLKLDTSQIRRSAISPDGAIVVTGYEEGAIRVWDGQTGKKLSEYTNHAAPITSLTFNPDGKYLASADSQGNVILWSVISDHRLKPSEPFTDTKESAIQTLLFSADSKTLVGGGCGYPITFPAPECGQGAIYVWDTQPHLKLRHKPLPGKAGFILSVAFNPVNPDEMAVGTRDGTVTIWNLRIQRPRLSFRLGKSDISALAFSPDGKLLIVGADGYKIFMYDSRTGQLFGRAFREHDDAVGALALTSDGNTLLSASSDGTVVIHDINPESWQARACRMANRNLTRSEWDQYIGETLSYQAICSEFPIEPEPNATP